MTQQDFLELLNKLEAEEHRLLDVKGMEYTQADNKENRLANFQRLAVELNDDPKKILWVYLKKHLDAILCYIKIGHTVSEESSFGRIKDARNYLALLAGLITEEQEKKLSQS